jgi:hypothetical protein
MRPRANKIGRRPAWISAAQNGGDDGGTRGMVGSNMFLLGRQINN